MIKNLVIQNIPKNQEHLKKILRIIGDHTWTAVAIAEWSICDNTNTIFYDKECDCYVWSNQGTKPINPKLIWKDYKQVINP